VGISPEFILKGFLRKKETKIRRAENKMGTKRMRI